MAADPHAKPAHDLAAELERRVAERFEAGDYPADLEAELDAHFRRILEARGELFDPRSLHERMARVDHAAGFSADRIELGATSVPGGAALHRAAAKLVSRQTAGILEQSQEFAAAVREVLHALVAATEHVIGRVDGDLGGRVDLLLDEVFTPTGGTAEAASTAALVRGVVRGSGTVAVIGSPSSATAEAVASVLSVELCASEDVADGVPDADELVIVEPLESLGASGLLDMLDRVGRGGDNATVVLTLRARDAAARELIAAAALRAGFGRVEHHTLRGGGGLVVGHR